MTDETHKHCIIIESETGGQTIDTFNTKEKSDKMINKVYCDVVEHDLKLKMYYSKVRYNKQRNVLDGKLINSNSKLIINTLEESKDA